MTNDEYLKELASRGDGSLQAWFDAEHVDSTRSAKRAAAVERLKSVKQATDENLLDAILGAPNGMTLYGAEKLVALKALLTDDDGVARSNDGVDAEHVDAQSKAQSKTESNLTEQSESLSDEATDSREKLEAPNQQISKSDAPKPAESGEILATKDDIRDFDDSRAKLVADIWAGCEHLTTMKDGILVNVSWRRLIGWLDRQAEITRKTEQAAWIQQANGLIHEANRGKSQSRTRLLENLVSQHRT